MPVELRKLETVYQGYMTLMTATLTAEDGTTFKREIEHHGHAAAVLPYDPVRRTGSYGRTAAAWPWCSISRLKVVPSPAAIVATISVA